MATITSAQSGNFSATSTWVGGVVPIDADSFIIATGHTVTYDVTSPVANGFNDSDIYGILQHASGTNTVLRMNGRLRIRTAGTYHMRDGAKLQINGSNTESHILFQLNESGASFIAEGSDGMPSTTLSSAINEGSTVLAVTSATNFAVGEWIAVFDNITARTTTGQAEDLRDEGFWIHDIDGNNIYFRQYVGPTSNVTSASGTALTVANAKVFRVGQKIIFGTGANRNVRTISAINYTTNVLTLNSSVTGSVVGVPVYETGTDKIHKINEKVRKVATVTTASSLSTATTITVANANMFTAGDEIWIEARSECGGATDTGDDVYATYVKTVQSVAGNVITLTGQVGYNVVNGALVTRLTRNVVVETFDTVNDRGAFYAEYLDSTYNRKLIMKDVYFRKIGGSNGNAESGVTWRGFFSTNSPAVTLSQTIPSSTNTPWIEGITHDQGGNVRDWSGLWAFDSRYSTIRCSFTHNGNSGLAIYYEPGNSVYNSIAVKNDTAGLRYEGNNEYSEAAYLYLSRNENGVRLIDGYEDGLGKHHIICDAVTAYSLSIFNSIRGPVYYKHQYTGSRFGLICENSFASILYGKLDFASGYTNPPNGTPQAGAFYAGHIDRGNFSFQQFGIIEDNFEYNAAKEFTYNGIRIWDTTENAWRVYYRYDASDYGTGAWTESLYIPPGVTVRASLAIKLAPGFSGTYPRFEARSTQSQISVNRVGNASGNWGSWFAGGSSTQQYTAAAETDYETKEITIAATTFPRHIQIGLIFENANQSEGCWMQPMQIYLDNPYAIQVLEHGNSGSEHHGASYQVSSSFNQNLIRLSGLRLN